MTIDSNWLILNIDEQLMTHGFVGGDNSISLISNTNRLIVIDGYWL